jgi:hypothetical protein
MVYKKVLIYNRFMKIFTYFKGFLKNKGNTNKHRHENSYFNSFNAFPKFLNLPLIKSDSFIDVPILKQPIKPYYQEFGIYEKQLLKVIGRPSFRISNYNGIQQYQILFFKHKSSEHKFLLQFHFFKDSLILYAIDYRSDINETQREVILKNTFEKLGYQVDVKAEKLVLKDLGDNLIFFNKSVNLSLVYVSGLPKAVEFQKLVKQFHEEKQLEIALMKKQVS